MPRRPDILVVLADDMGFSDIGCFGSEIPTPVLDRLAERGVRQSQFYNCARCCPTRASLLTGVHPHRAGIGQMTGDRGLPGYRGFLLPEVPTVAERLRAAGYRTWMSGKWHAGGDYAVHLPQQWLQAGDATHPTPIQRGFDRFYGMLCGAGSYFDPPCLMDQQRLVGLDELPASYYLTDELGARAAAFIDEVPDGEPFFGYLAFTAPHWPLHAPEADIAIQRGRYAGGWDALREQRLANLVRLGVLCASQALSPRDPLSRPWAEAEDAAWEAERMAVYAAQVAAMDRAVGVVVERLRARGRLDDTLIVFLSDNGGCAEYLREDGEAGRWPEIYAQPGKDGRPTRVGNRPGVAPGPADTFMSYDLPWANASNTPFRKWLFRKCSGNDAVHQGDTLWLTRNY
jgi:arylsulfatase